MPGQRGTEKRRLDGGQVLVRLPASLGSAVGAAAAAGGLTCSAWFRALAVTAIGANPLDAMPVRAYQAAKPLPSADVVRLAEIREALAEATGALKKSAVFAREHGAAETHALIEGLIPIYRQHADELLTLKKRIQAAVG